jgi:arylsulfatase
MHLCPRPPSTSLALLALLLTACGSGGASQDPATDRRPNLLLVSMDTCRFDRTGLAGYQRDTTPNLDHLARQGASFERAYVQANETLFSHAAVFTARHPGDLARLDDDFHVPGEVRTLAEVLQLYGYETAAFTGGAHMSAGTGLQRGFDEYWDEVFFGSFFHSIPAASAWLEQPREAPFFALVHGYDCHSPYVKPLYLENLFDPDYAGIADRIIPHKDGVERVYEGRFYPEVRPGFTTNAQGKRAISDDFFRDALPRAKAEDQPSEPVGPADLHHMEAHYDASLAYADLQLGLLLARLDELELAEDTIVVVFSDHGEGLTDYGHFHHRLHLRENVIHVPLVIFAPQRAETHGRVIHRFVSAIDIAPTVLELAGVPPLQGVPGESLVPLLSGGVSSPQGPIFSQSRYQVSVRVPGEQLVLDRAALDPLSARDPEPGAASYARFEGELPEGSQPLGAEALELRLRAWVEGLSPSDVRGQGMDEQLREALRERGYW